MDEYLNHKSDEVKISIMKEGIQKEKSHEEGITNESLDLTHILQTRGLDLDYMEQCLNKRKLY